MTTGDRGMVAASIERAPTRKDGASKKFFGNEGRKINASASHRKGRFPRERVIGGKRNRLHVSSELGRRPGTLLFREKRLIPTRGKNGRGTAQETSEAEHGRSSALEEEKKGKTDFLRKCNGGLHTN